MSLVLCASGDSPDQWRSSIIVTSPLLTWWGWGSMNGPYPSLIDSGNGIVIYEGMNMYLRPSTSICISDHITSALNLKSLSLSIDTERLVDCVHAMSDIQRWDEIIYCHWQYPLISAVRLCTTSAAALYHYDALTHTIAAVVSVSTIAIVSWHTASSQGYTVSADLPSSISVPHLQQIEYEICMTCNVMRSIAIVVLVSYLLSGPLDHYSTPLHRIQCHLCSVCLSVCLSLSLVTVSTVIHCLPMKIIVVDTVQWQQNSSQQLLGGGLLQLSFLISISSLLFRLSSPWPLIHSPPLQSPHLIKYIWIWKYMTVLYCTVLNESLAIWDSRRI